MCVYILSHDCVNETKKKMQIKRGQYELTKSKGQT